MRGVPVCAIALLVLLAMPSPAQVAAAEDAAVAEGEKAAPAPQAGPAGEMDVLELMRQMGADEQELLFFQLMSKAAGADMGEMMLLMMLAEEMPMNDDLMGMMFFSKLLGGGSSKQPVALLDDPYLLIIEDGAVYRINRGTWEVEEPIHYRPGKGSTTLPADLAPFLQQARAKAQGTACLSNMKQLCLGAMMYAQDFGQMLPGEGWPDDLQPYIQNREIYRCPVAPEKEIGFALNDQLAGAKMGDVPRPAEVPLFFESQLADDIPFGGAEAVPTEPRHDGMVTVGFVDGHAKMMTPDALRDLLGQDPFR